MTSTPKASLCWNTSCDVSNAQAVFASSARGSGIFPTEESIHPPFRVGVCTNGNRSQLRNACYSIVHGLIEYLCACVHLGDSIIELHSMISAA